jgi:hypothetical protein
MQNCLNSPCQARTPGWSLSVLALASFLSLPASAVTPPSTGQNVVLDATGRFRDLSYQIVSDTTAEFNLKGNTPPSTSYSVPYSTDCPSPSAPCGQGNGWDVTGRNWVGPDPDQRNITRANGAWTGTTTYQITFTVTEITSTMLFMNVAADDSVIVKLNGTVNQLLS